MRGRKSSQRPQRRDIYWLGSGRCCWLRPMMKAESQVTKTPLRTDSVDCRPRLPNLAAHKDSIESQEIWDSFFVARRCPLSVFSLLSSIHNTCSKILFWSNRARSAEHTFRFVRIFVIGKTSSHSFFLAFVRRARAEQKECVDSLVIINELDIDGLGKSNRGIDNEVIVTLFGQFDIDILIKTNESID